MFDNKHNMDDIQEGNRLITEFYKECKYVEYEGRKFELSFRKATSEDIIKGNIVYLLGDDNDIYTKQIVEVLRPDDFIGVFVPMMVVDTEEFNQKRSEMSNEELIKLAEKEVSELARTYGKSHRMCIPPMITDTDMLLSELIRRFKSISK